MMSREIVRICKSWLIIVFLQNIFYKFYHFNFNYAVIRFRLIFNFKILHYKENNFLHRPNKRPFESRLYLCPDMTRSCKCSASNWALYCSASPANFSCNYSNFRNVDYSTINFNYCRSFNFNLWIAKKANVVWIFFFKAFNFKNSFYGITKYFDSYRFSWNRIEGCNLINTRYFINATRSNY